MNDKKQNQHLEPLKNNSTDLVEFKEKNRALAAIISHGLAHICKACGSQYGEVDLNAQALAFAPYLRKYTPEQLQAAFEEYPIRYEGRASLKRLLEILDPQPVFDLESYHVIRKKYKENEYSLSNKQKAYMQFCEDRIMGVKS